jgi:agmatinase
MPSAGKKTGGFAFLAVPYERTTTFEKGASGGPELILRDWERLRRTGEVPEPSRVLRLPERSLSGPRSLLRGVREATARLSGEGLLPVLLGGEHTCTIGAVDGLKGRHHDLGVIQLDAHADLRPSYGGSRYNHACVMRRLSQDRGVPLLPLGIRAYSRQEAAYMKSEGITGLPGRLLDRWPELLPPLLARMPARVYLTIDMDFFDPSVVPGVGTPEPGGGQWYETLDMLDGIIEGRQVVGFDVVELCPPREERFSIRAASRLIGHLLERLLSRPRRD